jgi:hypothetical protein
MKEIIKMGLDITAYKNVKVINHLSDVEDWEENYYMKGREDTVYIYPSLVDWFPEWAEGLEYGAVYEYEDAFGFRAGSYSGYNWWREWLCETFLGVSPQVVWDNPKDFQNAPFYRLIHFADSEGYISKIHAEKLAKDFQKYQDDIDLLDDEDWTKQAYNNWRKAFEMASENGFVGFH